LYLGCLGWHDLPAAALLTEVPVVPSQDCQLFHSSRTDLRVHLRQMMVQTCCHCLLLLRHRHRHRFHLHVHCRRLNHHSHYRFHRFHRLNHHPSRFLHLLYLLHLLHLGSRLQNLHYQDFCLSTFLQKPSKTKKSHSMTTIWLICCLCPCQK
jgi:hypothetical protein